MVRVKFLLSMPQSNFVRKVVKNDVDFTVFTLKSARFISIIEPFLHSNERESNDSVNFESLLRHSGFNFNVTLSGITNGRTFKL